ncbi:site-specific integrase [soil metagenome]
MAASHRLRRSAGEGSVYQSADGRWRAALVVTHPNDGRRTRRVVSGRSKAETVRKLDALKKVAAAGAFPGSETTGEYLTRWLVRTRDDVRPSSWRQREQYARLYLIPAMGLASLAKLTPGDVERMTSGMITAGRSPTTAAGARVILRRALADALRDGLVTRNVAALARPPRRTQREIEYLHPAQLRTLLAACESDPIGPLVTVAATTGLRQGELLGLTWSDVEEGTLTVRRALGRARDGGWELSPPKTSRSRRSVRLPAAAVAAFARQRELQAQDRADVGTAWQDVDGIVFTDPVGRYLRGYNVTKAFQRLLTAARLPSVPFHALRHSTATALLSEGVPLRVVADVLGHSTIVVTANVYAAVVPELRREAADAMDRALS